MAPFDLAATLGVTGSYLVYLGIGFGFGFILESSGFGDSRKLAAQFYFRELRVLKVMFTAIVVAMLLGFAVVPFGPELYVLDINIGLLFFLGMTSLAVYSVLLAGLASNNKYALLGGLRSAAQMVSYEVPLALSLLAPVVLSASLNFAEMSKVMATGFTRSGSLATSSTVKPSGTFILAIASAGERAGPGGLS